MGAEELLREPALLFAQRLSVWKAASADTTQRQDQLSGRAEPQSPVMLCRRKGCKLCPRCGHGILKGGGCSRMTCRCGLSFCWDCLADLRNAPRHAEAR